MPNWCEGVLKARGTKEEIINFLKNGLEPLGGGLFGEKPEQVETNEDEWEFNMKTKHGFYLKESRRNFIESNIEFYLDTDEEIKVCVMDGFKAAWGLDTEALIKASKTFNIDLKIYAFERGMEYNHDFEVHKGVLVKDNVIEFDKNYDWECIDPTIGG